MIYDSILGTIGRTPIVRMQRLAPAGVTMYVKCEFFNPGSSVKDRLAIAIIEDAEARGALKPGQTVVEATSGNTGIALAMVCAAKGYPFVAVMVETFSVERRKIMRMLGANVILTPAAERGTGMVRKAAELAQKHGWFLARQFENPANPGLSPQHHRPGNPVRLCRSAPGLLRDRLGHRRHADRRRRDDSAGAARRTHHRCRARGRRRCCRASPSHRTRSRAGRRTSCPPCSIARCRTASSPSPTPRPSTPRACWRARKASSAASPRGATFAAALKVARAGRRRARCVLAMLPDTGERYLSTAAVRRHPRWLGSRNPETRRPSASGAPPERRATVSDPGDRRAARSVCAVSGRRAARRAHRLRELGPAERGARQRHPAVHRPVALGARGRHRRAIRRRAGGSA